MSAKYLVRMDDACPTMSEKKWDAFERIFDNYQIKPIIAVIPKNEDLSLNYDNANPLFWDKVRNWRDKGWCIALHGYDHVYKTSNAGMVPFNCNSEFAGLSLEMQREKIKLGVQIFRDQGIDPECFIAPAHSFDENTLEALKMESNVQLISDGIGLFPFKAYGFKWIPQQIWKLRKMPLGIWTCNIHPNTSSDNYIAAMELFIKENFTKFIGVNDLSFAEQKGTLDKLFSFLYWKARYFLK